MGREGAKSLLHSLLIANVSIDPLEYCKFGTWFGGNMQPGLGHQRQQTHCFEGHSLASSVRPGNYQNMEFIAKPDINRHNLSLKQRMPPLFDVNAPLIVHHRFYPVYGPAVA